MKLQGLHHVTAVTAKAKDNLAFYTKVLGLHLVKKTVNQDDVSAYHLFYADKLGTPGTDMTFFDWATAGPRHGETDGILRTMFRVNGREALEFWKIRFSELEVKHSEIQDMGGRDALFFEDFEGQRLALVDDQGAEFEGEVWDKEVPAEKAIRGFFGVQLVVPAKILVDGLMKAALGFEKGEDYPSLEIPGETVSVYTLNGGGPGKEVHMVEREGKKMWALAGGVHHVAFRVEDEAELQEWADRLTQIRIPNSGIVERFYFISLYFHISENILFELATNGPGFAADEDPQHLGESLSLPPFLEPQRAQIEAGLKPL